MLPQPLQEGEFAGFFFHLAEQVADGLGLLILLQEVGQQATTEKGTEHREDLGRKGAALLLAQPQALFGLFEKHLYGPAAHIFLHYLDGGQGEIRGEKGGPGGLRLDFAAWAEFWVRLYSARRGMSSPDRGVNGNSFKLLAFGRSRLDRALSLLSFKVGYHRTAKVLESPPQKSIWVHIRN